MKTSILCDGSLLQAFARRGLNADGLNPGDGAKLRERLAALRALYERHIGIEDRELFPAAARLLDARAIGQVGREMAERRGVRPRQLS